MGQRNGQKCRQTGMKTELTLLPQFQYDIDISMMVSYRSNGNFIITFATEITKRLCLNNNFVYHTSTVYHVEITITMLKQQFCLLFIMFATERT